LVARDTDSSKKQTVDRTTTADEGALGVYGYPVSHQEQAHQPVVAHLQGGKALALMKTPTEDMLCWIRREAEGTGRTSCVTRTPPCSARLKEPQPLGSAEEHKPWWNYNAPAVPLSMAYVFITTFWHMMTANTDELMMTDTAAFRRCLPCPPPKKRMTP